MHTVLVTPLVTHDYFRCCRCTYVCFDSSLCYAIAQVPLGPSQRLVLPRWPLQRGDGRRRGLVPLEGMVVLPEDHHHEAASRWLPDRPHQRPQRCSPQTTLLDQRFSTGGVSTLTFWFLIYKVVARSIPTGLRFIPLKLSQLTFHHAE